MNDLKIIAGVLALIIAIVPELRAQQDTVVVRPHEINDVLNNPGKGFTTFQRFNGDELNVAGEGWTEGFPIEYQEFDGNLENIDHPQTTIAYFRVYWKYFEPKEREYNWEMIDKALKTAHERGQKLMLRIAPYGPGNEIGKDVPDWYREMVGDNRNWAHDNPVNAWQVDANDPRYVEYFGGAIRALGERYDGHPDMEAVDGSIVGAWGEGGGSELLTKETMKGLVDAYVESFKKTPVIMLLMDEKTNTYALSKKNVSWRVDCIGDMGFWADEQDGWTHMFDFYPQAIINYGVQDAWKTAPISLEICGTFTRWKEREGYDLEDVEYIFEQSLKWRLSSFNAKSSPVPEDWQPAVDEWLKKMGYRFVLRRFSYPETVAPGEKLAFTSWWENKGVAPIYRKYPLALRLRGSTGSTVLLTDADIREWMPGDNLYDGAVFVPWQMAEGDYELELALIEPPRVSETAPQPVVDLAIEGRTGDGWYSLGRILVEKRN